MGSLGERSLMTMNSTKGREKEGRLKIRFFFIRIQTPLFPGWEMSNLMAMKSRMLKMLSGLTRDSCKQWCQIVRNGLERGQVASSSPCNFTIIVWGL